ncbi:hypothetical protein Q4Q35_05635 [Flavivirga aquimarina]|uniref:Uncharacterized protein n=1 Tax=Flavivirga aquimarina TaxID=2027862 RepID=A0ABT8W820_9FLAO|nr:DUF6796 family protein [Flavivirga aquimarina]MDO5969283.1 hypothetical protein [Flavivirga aquimarina]
MNINHFWVRVMGLSGILGGLILFAGDMLLYYDPINTSLNQNMGNASDLRIITSGVSALFGTWFYIIGMGQVYYAFKPTNTISKNIVMASFASILIAFGIVHGAFIAIATSAKLATEYNLDMKSTISLALETNNIMRLFVYPIFAILSFVFITQVWKKRTSYSSEDCIKKGLGQLLSYVYHEEQTFDNYKGLKKKIVICGKPKAKPNDLKFINYINNSLKVKFEYLSIEDITF